MDPIEKRELKRKAWIRLGAQRRRAGLLRGRVVALSLICFAVLWAVVFAQMATGNDPVLGNKEKAVVTRTEASLNTEIETTDPRELEPERRTDSKKEALEAEAAVEAEGELEEVEAGAEEAEFVGSAEEETAQVEAAEAEAAEIEAAEIAEIEAAEAEALVTSQS
jgi:non-ribosomal peptide synthetase component E (peptide arylation enzyme)